MTQRDLFRLPFNRDFEITDGNYTYIVKKIMSEEDKELGIKSEPIYRWTIKGCYDTFIMVESIDKDDNCKILKKVIRQGGFSSISNVDHYDLRRISIVNNNNLNKWLKSLNT